MESIPHRKPTRLPDYSYSEPGGYFLTLCTNQKQCILWHGDRLSPTGLLVQQQLEKMSNFYANITIEKSVVMPNHVHLLLLLHPGSGPAIPRFVSTFKRFTNQSAGQVLWQRSFYDHVVRNEDDYLRIWKYIDENPAKWLEDQYFFEE